MSLPLEIWRLIWGFLPLRFWFALRRVSRFWHQEMEKVLCHQIVSTNHLGVAKNLVNRGYELVELYYINMEKTPTLPTVHTLRWYGANYFPKPLLCNTLIVSLGPLDSFPQGCQHLYLHNCSIKQDYEKKLLRFPRITLGNCRFPKKFSLHNKTNTLQSLDIWAGNQNSLTLKISGVQKISLYNGRIDQFRIRVKQCEELHINGRLCGRGIKKCRLTWYYSWHIESSQAEEFYPPKD